MMPDYLGHMYKIIFFSKEMRKPRFFLDWFCRLEDVDISYHGIVKALQ